MNDEQPPQTIEPTFEVLAPEPPPPPGPKLRHALTLANLWHVWIGLKNGAPSSVIVYQGVARRFCKFFGPHANGCIPHKLTPQGMTEWHQHLLKHKSAYRVPRPYSQARLCKINAVAKSFLRWMRTMKYINEDLASCIPVTMAPAPKESLIFTEEEYERVKAWCAGRPHYQTYLWLFILGYRTGMSIVDCCHLRWKDVHLHDNEPSYIEIRRIKIQRFGDKAKCQIPIVPFSDIHLWLLNLRNVTPWKRFDGITDYVHQETQAIYAGSVARPRNAFRQIFRRAGIDPRKTFKCLRNSMCSNLVNSGMNLASVCTITGHNSVATLMRYLKTDMRVLQDGLAKSQQYSALKDKPSSDGMQEGDAAFL